MIRGMYTAVSSLITLEAKQGVITNNLTNVNTPGFKPDELVISQFEKVMLSNRDKGINSYNNLGEMSIGSKIDSTITKYAQGGLKQTEKVTDFSLTGPGFFTVNKNGQEYYTRDGSFIIDIHGNLMTQNGANVMGINLTNGAYEPIKLGDLKDVSVDGGNNILTNGIPVYKIKVSNFDDYKKLKKIQGNLFSSPNPATENLTTKVQNRSLEISSVNLAEEIVNLTNVLRSFESSMKVLSYLDSSLEIAANQLGKV